MFQYSQFKEEGKFYLQKYLLNRFQDELICVILNKPFYLAKWYVFIEKLKPIIERTLYPNNFRDIFIAHWHADKITIYVIKIGNKLNAYTVQSKAFSFWGKNILVP